VRLIGWLCVMGAGISLMVGLASGHFAPHRRRCRHSRSGRRRSDFGVFLREDFPGFIPGAVIAAGLLALGLLILVTWGLGPG